MLPATLDTDCSMISSRFAMPGIGYALRENNRYILNDPAINAVEITFERADDPLRVDRYLGDQEFDHVGVHALKLSVASPDAPGLNYLESLLAIAEENNAESISDHLGGCAMITRSSGTVPCSIDVIGRESE